MRRYHSRPLNVNLPLSRSFLALTLFATSASAQSASEVRSAPAAAVSQVPSSHILAPNERVEIKVFQEPELDTAARIPEDGRITFPLIGEVALGGTSVQQATRLIRDRLQARFLVNPQVTITVVEEARRLFTVLGQVQRPGTYRFPERQALDLVQVIGIAGGYTRIADPSKIMIKRRTGGKETVLRLDGKRLMRDERAESFAVESGDIITVGERLF